MKLSHSIKVVDKMLARMESDRLSGEKALSISRPSTVSLEEQAAVLVVLRFAKRVMAAKESLRALARAVSGEDDLNQESLDLEPD